jgi:hypothetical protein
VSHLHSLHSYTPIFHRELLRTIRGGLLPRSLRVRLLPRTVSVSQVKLTLRLTVSQSVNLGVEPHLGLMTRYLLLSWQLRSCFCGAPSLTRDRVCLLCMLLALANAVFLGSESLGTRDHVVPCWRYLLRDYRLSHAIFHTFFIPDHTVGIAIALLQPALTLTVSTTVLPVDSLIQRRFPHCLKG